MGVGYYQPLIQWSKGEYADANNKEDDYAVMAANGLVARADDHGNTVATATPLSGTSAGGVTTLEAEGVIERTERYRRVLLRQRRRCAVVQCFAGGALAEPGPAGRTADGAGTLLASANPVDALPATLSITVPLAGTYFV